MFDGNTGAAQTQDQKDAKMCGEPTMLVCGLQACRKGHTTSCYLSLADKIEHIKSDTATGCLPALFAQRGEIAAALRLMAARPGDPAHVEVLTAVTLFGGFPTN